MAFGGAGTCCWPDREGDIGQSFRSRSIDPPSTSIDHARNRYKCPVPYHLPNLLSFLKFPEAPNSPSAATYPCALSFPPPQPPSTTIHHPQSRTSGRIFAYFSYLQYHHYPTWKPRAPATSPLPPPISPISIPPQYPKSPEAGPASRL